MPVFSGGGPFTDLSRDSPELLLNNHCGADFGAIVEIDNVVIGHADAARRGRCADGMRLVGAVDAVLGVAEIQRARAEWIRPPRI